MKSMNISSRRNMTSILYLHPARANKIAIWEGGGRKNRELVPREESDTPSRRCSRPRLMPRRSILPGKVTSKVDGGSSVQTTLFQSPGFTFTGAPWALSGMRYEDRVGKGTKRNSSRLQFLPPPNPHHRETRERGFIGENSTHLHTHTRILRALRNSAFMYSSKKLYVMSSDMKRHHHSSGGRLPYSTNTSAWGWLLKRSPPFVPHRSLSFFRFLPLDNLCLLCHCWDAKLRRIFDFEKLIKKCSFRSICVFDTENTSI